jgi:membrane protease YdiL (CAAX protease family)
LAALAVNLVLVFGMAVAALLLAVWAGSARIEVTGEPVTRYLGAAMQVGGVLAVAAFAEELLFRGYPLARLARPLGRVGASGWNPNVSNLGLTNIALASLVLSAAFFTPGGLPVAWGVHFGLESERLESRPDEHRAGVAGAQCGLLHAGGPPRGMGRARWME